MDKFFLWSKTVQGIILMIVPTLSASLGFDWSAEDASYVESAFAGVGAIAEKAVEVAGIVLAFYGRWKATAALKVMP